MYVSACDTPSRKFEKLWEFDISLRAFGAPMLVYTRRRPNVCVWVASSPCICSMYSDVSPCSPFPSTQASDIMPWSTPTLGACLKVRRGILKRVGQAFNRQSGVAKAFCRHEGGLSRQIPESFFKRRLHEKRAWEYKPAAASKLQSLSCSHGAF